MKGWDGCSHLTLAHLSPPEAIHAWTDTGSSTVWHKKGGDKDETDLREWWQMISYHAGPGAYRMVCSSGNPCGLVLLKPHLQEMLGWKGEVQGREVQGRTLSLSTVNTGTTALLIGWEGLRINLCFFFLEFIFIYLLTQGS